MITASNDKAIFHPLSSTYPYQDWGGGGTHLKLCQLIKQHFFHYVYSMVTRIPSSLHAMLELDKQQKTDG